MYSIAVLGDLVTNILEPANGRVVGKDLTETGGALLLAKAVRNALLGLNLPSTEQVPTLFSPGDGTEEFGEGLGPKCHYWRFKQTQLIHHYEHLSPDPKGYRLGDRREKPAGDDYPEFNLAFRRALSPFTTNGTEDGCFNPSGTQFPWCPSVVVFDDSGSHIRNIHIEGPTPSPGAPVEHVEWKLKPEGPSAPPLSVSKNDLKRRYESAFKCLVKRLRLAGAIIRDDKKLVPLDPVIICCVDGRLPRFSNRENANSFWDSLANDCALSDRTIVILEAKDLREVERLTISSGLSWERTAQDTIAGLTRSEQGRRVLGFSQVVIRFGVAGALHIHRRDEENWTYQLFFDSSRGDTSWTEEVDKTGEMLGHSYVFAATFIQHLTRICNSRGKTPHVHDLAAAIAEAIPSAIARSQKLVHTGYPFAKKSGQKGEFLPAELFWTRLDRETHADRSRISNVMVPQLRSRSWSILSQAVQGRSGFVARNIVLYGNELALNQRVPTKRELHGAFIRKIVDRVRHWIQEADTLPETDSTGPRSVVSSAEREVGLIQEIQEFYESIAKCNVRLPGVSFKDFKEALSPAILHSVVLACRAVIDAFQPLWRNTPPNSRTKPPTAKTGGRTGKSGDSAAPTDDRPITSRIDDALHTLAEELLKRLSNELRLPSRLNLRFDPVSAPLVALGLKQDFILVDRREIEGIRALQKLIKSHIDNPTSQRPLSIAVFGPPGSGKTTAVRRIVEELEEAEVLQDPFNLAQFTKSEDLDSAFDEIVKKAAATKGNKRKVPVAFFDEFDSRFEDEQWGWLKFFLSPMEDGLYRGKPVRNSIFVFAGGTSATYSQFSLENRSSTDPQVQAFGLAKGPDFVSRLHGFLNVVGVNPADSDDELYLIRRAVVIRSMLANIQNLEPNQTARIDPDMLRATLFVPMYHNNARSIRTLLEMCSRSANNRVSNSSLPLIHQLNMLTDGKAFLDLLGNVSSGDDEDGESAPPEDADAE